MLMLLVAHNRLYPLLLYCGHAWLFVCVEDFRDIQSDCEFGMLAVEAADAQMWLWQAEMKEKHPQQVWSEEMYTTMHSHPRTGVVKMVSA